MFKYNCENCGHETHINISTPNVTKEKPLTKENKSRRKFQTKNVVEKIEQNAVEKIEQSDIYNVPNCNLTNSLNFPVQVEIKHKGFWVTDMNGIHVPLEDQKCDNNSVMLTNDCLLYIYKLALRHYLLAHKIIDVSDIDNANLVPHIRVRKDKNDSFSKYNFVQNKIYIIKQQDISIKNDFMTIEIDRKKDLHFTMIFSKGIKSKVDLLKAFKTVLAILNMYPNLMHEYSLLPYFGEQAMEYWYGDSSTLNHLGVTQVYPFNVTPPQNYVLSKENVNTVCKTTIAGSIIE